MNINQNNDFFILLDITNNKMLGSIHPPESIIAMIATALLLLVTTPIPGVHGALFGSLFGSTCRLLPIKDDRCGLFAAVVHQGTPGSLSCTETCVRFPLFHPNVQCGPCGNLTAVADPNANRTTTPVSPGYDITLNLVGIPPADQAYFTSAQARWEAVLTGDLFDVPSALLPPPDVAGCVYPAVIDDLYLCAVYEAIDGAKGVLAYSTPVTVRASARGDKNNQPGLPITGEMVFDAADIAFLKNNAGGDFNTTILHEMGHVHGEWKKRRAFL